MPPRVDNSRLRAEYLRRQQIEGLTAGELASRIGWQHPGNPSQGPRVVQWALGVKPYHSHGQQRLRERIQQDKALALAAGLHLDPVDIGV